MILRFGIPSLEAISHQDTGGMTIVTLLQKSFKSTIGSLYLNATQKYNQDIEWIEEKTDTVIKNSRVIERWHDKRTDIFYTLVEHKKR